MSWRPRDTDSIRTGSDMITFRPEITINLADTDPEIVSQVASQLQDAAAGRPVSRSADRTAKLSPRSVVANAMRARIGGLNATTSSPPRNSSWSPPRYRRDLGRDYGEDDFDHHYPAHIEGKVTDTLKKAMKKGAEKVKKTVDKAKQKLHDSGIRPQSNATSDVYGEDSDTCDGGRCSRAYDEDTSHYSRAYDGTGDGNHLDVRAQHRHRRSSVQLPKDWPKRQPTRQPTGHSGWPPDDYERRRGRSVQDVGGRNVQGVRSRYGMRML